MKNPIGIRFNDEKLNFVKEKEGLSSPQKVVNFLLEKYWWENKGVAIETVSMDEEAKIASSKFDTVKLIDGYENPIKEVSFFVTTGENKTDYTSYGFTKAINAARSREELNSVTVLIEKYFDGLPKEKSQLLALAQAIFKDKFDFGIT